MSYLIAQQEVFKFISQFGTAYRNKAPQGSELPYLIYNIEDNNFGENAPLQIVIYSQSESYLELTSIVEKIENVVPQIGSVIIENEKGNISISRGSPFAQDYEQEEDTIKALYINLQIMLNLTK